MNITDFLILISWPIFILSLALLILFIISYKNDFFDYTKTGIFKRKFPRKVKREVE